MRAWGVVRSRGVRRCTFQGRHACTTRWRGLVTQSPRALPSPQRSVHAHCAEGRGGHAGIVSRGRAIESCMHAAPGTYNASRPWNVQRPTHALQVVRFITTLPGGVGDQLWRATSTQWLARRAVHTRTAACNSKHPCAAAAADPLKTLQLQCQPGV